MPAGEEFNQDAPTRTTRKQAKTEPASDLSREARRLSKKYSTNYVDVLEPSNSGRSPVVSIKSLVTLRRTLRRVPCIPDQRVGNGESGGPEGGLAADLQQHVAHRSTSRPLGAGRNVAE